MTDPGRVARHGFFPFVMRPRTVMRYGEGEGGKRLRGTKVRPVAYAAHMDTHIHAYYAYLLNERLEIRLRQPFGESVLAYRRMAPKRCNVDFACQAFEEVWARGEADVLAIDVEGFFDALNHDHLKAAWADLLGTSRLPADHFAVFHSITRDRAVSWPRLRRALKDRQRSRAGRDGAPICSLDEFRSLVLPLCEPRSELAWSLKGKAPPPCIPTGVPVGIPQGSAISAVLANVYMLAADERLHARLGAIGASYRRYSDDILVIGPPGSLACAEVIVAEELGSCQLHINADKTERVLFRSAPGGGHAATVIPSPSAAPVPGALVYLGLSYDGRATGLRDSTVARYLIRMRRMVNRGRIAAKTGGTNKILRRQIYARMSELGPGRAYGRWRQVRPGHFIPPEHAPRLGFVGYAQRAAGRAGEALPERITDQHGRLWECLHVALAQQEDRLKSK